MTNSPLKAGETWTDGDVLQPPRLTALDWLRVLRRGVAAVVGILVLLVLLLALRVVEKPIWGERRPMTLTVKRWGCRWTLFCMGLPWQMRGTIMHEAGAVVCNHSGWVDIFALGAAADVTFVSKSEVASWPGIGLLAKATGTLFIKRDAREAGAQVALLQERFAAGQRLLFFPEGTSTDNQRVLPFKTTLFASFFATSATRISVQPVSVVYHAPQGADARFYGWWGNLGFVPHLLMILSAKRQGRVEILAHTPLHLADFSGRKELALACEQKVREGFVALR